MALNFLTEIALKAFTTNEKGEYPATTHAICHDDYSGDLKPKASNNRGPKTIPRAGRLYLLAMCLPSSMCTPTIQQTQQRKNRKDNNHYPA